MCLSFYLELGIGLTKTPAATKEFLKNIGFQISWTNNQNQIEFIWSTTNWSLHRCHWCKLRGAPGADYILLGSRGAGERDWPVSVYHSHTESYVYFNFVFICIHNPKLIH
jgi:hypothetical protein